MQRLLATDPSDIQVCAIDKRQRVCMLHGVRSVARAHPT